MEKYIILSVNDNPEYLFYTPLTVWAWRKLDWEPIIFFNGKRGPISGLIKSTFDKLHVDMTAEMKFLYSLKVYDLDDLAGYESETITQISRLYGASCFAGRNIAGVSEDYYLMTGDIDMIPLSDYWKPDPNNLSVWGHDLTGYGHYPICYIGMPSDTWRKVMHLQEVKDWNYYIKRDLDSLPQARSHDRVKRWVTDQDLITERINKSGIPVDHYHRGTYKNGYARGRVDRSAWTLLHDHLIDCHMLRGIYKDQKAFNQTMDLLLKVWPNEDWQWFVNYRNEFKKLCQ
jgi:hypothetical protein